MIRISRRAMLAGLGGAAAGAAFGGAARAFGESTPRGHDLPMLPLDVFPRRADFAIPKDITFINSAYTHPLPVAAVRAVQEYLTSRSVYGVTMPDSGERVKAVKAGIASMINAKPAEIAFIPNTSTGENLVVSALGIAERAGSGINVVTDALHFDGALVHLQALQKDRGLDLRVVMPRDRRIEMADLERVVDARTALIEISLVAMYTGFEHDLAAVSALAHAHGAYVYADIIQAVGAVPIDVRATGVDFCAAGGFKWLMSDFGLGFLYVREELLERFPRTQWGYHSVDDVVTHFLPHDPPGSPFQTWTAGASAGEHYEVGHNANGALAALAVTVPYINGLGVGNIQGARQPILRKLEREMPRLGFEPMTPEGSTSPIITFATTDGAAVEQRLARAGINARVAEHFVRFSPSVFNDVHDADRILAALS